ncbi:MAG: PAS domain S-box protein [Burkholderiaceae bacterium]|nr:PAS domain S-box protein [Burkholderiaceae bacterium]
MSAKPSPGASSGTKAPASSVSSAARTRPASCRERAESAALVGALKQAHASYGAGIEAIERVVHDRTRALDAVRVRLETIIDAVSDGIVVFDARDRIESMNESAAGMLGLSGTQAHGSSTTALFGQPLADFVRQDEPRELRARSIDGGWVRMEVGVHRISIEGEVHFVATLRDLTEITYTRQRLLEQAFLLEKTRTFMLSSTPGQGVDWCNPSFEALTGYSLDEMRARSALDLLLDESSPPAARGEIDAAIAAGEPFSVELVLRHRSGRPFWVKVDGYPLPDSSGAPQRYVALGSDITARKREQQLRTDFVSTVSHELRTPLTVVSGVFDAMETRASIGQAPAADPLVEMGRRNALTLGRLIDDLLDTNRLEAGVVRFESEFVDPLGALRDAIQSIARIADPASVAIRLASTAECGRVFVDPSRLQQILANLLSNAVKFSRPGGEVELRVGDHGDQLRISVTDHGEGIPLEFQSEVFQRFARDPSVRARGTDGFGLGLYICRSLVEQMGGAIGFESSPGIGTRFNVDLPRMPPRHATPEGLEALAV